MAVFPLENGVFSGTLLRFNVRGYVYIWSLIFSMFKFFCACSLCMSIVGVFMRARRAYSLYIYLGGMGKWDLGGMGDWAIKWINWGIGD